MKLILPYLLASSFLWSQAPSHVASASTLPVETAGVEVSVKTLSNENSRQASRYRAYFEVANQLKDTYGLQSYEDGIFKQGLALVEIVDLNGDGYEELLVVYSTQENISQSKSYFEVWDYNGSSAQKKYTYTYSLEGHDLSVLRYDNLSATLCYTTNGKAHILLHCFSNAATQSSSVHMVLEYDGSSVVDKYFSSHIAFNEETSSLEETYSYFGNTVSKDTYANLYALYDTSLATKTVPLFLANVDYYSEHNGYDLLYFLEKFTTGDRISDYVDVNETDWHVDYVEFMEDQQIMKPLSETEFQPDTLATRGMIADAIYGFTLSSRHYSQNDLPLYNPVDNFSDTIGTPHEVSTHFVKVLNYMTGYGDNLFGVNDNVTREEFAAILYAFHKDEKISNTLLLNQFTDADLISPWATEALAWCVSQGLMGGHNGILNPSGNILRSEVAVMLYKYIMATKFV